MPRNQDIDEILKQWPFDPLSVNVRLLESRKRQVLQMRVDMGILQMETSDRPDGHRFHGFPTYFDYLQRKAEKEVDFRLDDRDCFEIDREFVQFYHRRVCWLQLKEFQNAVRDAKHTLSLMDFCKTYSPDEQWTISHEQYRPFVIYHRTQAAALAHVGQQDESGDADVSPQQAESAIEEVNLGLAQIKILFEEYEAHDQFEEDELVQRMMEFQQSLRERYGIDLTLQERLDQAIEREDYELAADLKNQLLQREPQQPTEET